MTKSLVNTGNPVYETSMVYIKPVAKREIKSK